MSRAPDQIALPLDWPKAEGPDRFILAESNRAAFEHFRAWSLWPVKATVLAGPRRSGRTMLARAFVERVGGRLFDDCELHDEEALFHAWNSAQDSGRPVVFVTGDREPWRIALPDLRTRIAVTPVVRILDPDDALFERLVELLFADRGLVIPPESLRYLVQRVNRDYWTAERVVEAIDRFAIADRARLTVPTVRRALIDAGLIDSRGAA
ncbi:HdaA/DnaA family protein [Sphingomonas mesophila]|uniref:HdaA/DnaA family protein n=1 Tax=Sphingomonas mesophila TaxID=2303576 RepID=UPI000E577BC6|nr:chromosomal replication initiator DnaA [Sphingomonas mesophila]